MKIELKPCPFCGGKAEMLEFGIDSNKTAYMPRCKTPCCCGRIGRKWPERDAAVYAWNRRKHDGN